MEFKIGRLAAVGGILRQHWFLIGIVVAIATARVAPWLGQKGGPLWPEVTVKYVAVALIFFNSGLTLRTEELKTALLQVCLCLCVYMYIYMPYEKDNPIGWHPRKTGQQARILGQQLISFFC